MNCKRIKRRLSAYLDNELKERTKIAISEHLKKCPECKKEFTNFLQQDKFIRQLEEIEPSDSFRPQFWQKVTNIEQSEIKIRAKVPKLSWVPIPVMGLLVAIIVLQLTIFSFTLFAREGGNVRTQIVVSVVKNFVIPSHPLNPVSLLRFCNECCKTLCKCTQKQEFFSKCVCKKCKINQENTKHKHFMNKKENDKI